MAHAWGLWRTEVRLRSRRVADALFVRDGDEVAPTGLTGGPWSPEAQHGGPPAALMAGEIERSLRYEMAIVRITVELLRPVPLEPFIIHTAVIRPGRRMQVMEAQLHRADKLVARAFAVCIRKSEIEPPTDQLSEPVPPPPSQGDPARMFARAGGFVNDAMEIQMLAGDFIEPGPGKAWFRLRVPVVEGTEPTPVETTCAAADCGNGVSNWSPDRSWLFINPDLTVYFARPPEGQWVLLDSVTMLHTSGTGLAESRLFDLSGRFGRSAQSLLVEPVHPE